MTLGTDALKQLVYQVITTRDDEISCTACFDWIDDYAEREACGGSPAETLPLVHHHLEHCIDCHTEYQALLDALQTLPSASLKL
jgi:hypothetical protein